MEGDDIGRWEAGNLFFSEWQRQNQKVFFFLSFFNICLVIFKVVYGFMGRTAFYFGFVIPAVATGDKH